MTQPDTPGQLQTVVNQKPVPADYDATNTGNAALREENTAPQLLRDETDTGHTTTDEHSTLQALQDQSVRLKQNDTETALQSQLASAEERLADRQKDLAETTAELAQTTAELAEKNADLAEKKAELAGTQADLASSKADLARKKAALADTTAALADTTAALADKEAALADKKAALADKKAALADKKAALADKKAALAAMRVKLGDTRRRIDSLMAVKLVADLWHCLRLISYHFAVKYQEEFYDSDSPALNKGAQGANEDRPDGRAFTAFTSSPSFQSFRDPAMIALIQEVDEKRVGNAHSNDQLMEWLAADAPACARLLKAELPGHDEAIDTLLGVINSLRTSLMSFTLPSDNSD